MRTPTPSCRFYYPLSQVTVHHVFSSVFSPFAKGLSSTLIIPRGFGGGKALSRFMTDHVDLLSGKTDLAVSTQTHRYCYIDPDELPGSRPQDYLDAIGRALVGGQALQRGFSLEQLKQIVWKEVTQKEMVFVLRGIDFLEHMTSSLWANVRSLQVFRERVHFLFILYDGAPVPLVDKRFDRIRDCMEESVFVWNVLRPADISYSIRRWEYMLGVQFSAGERCAVAKASGGVPSLLKKYCFMMAGNGAMSELQSLERPAEGFSRQESAVYHEFIRHSGTIVSKEQIAHALWGGQDLERYSEPAVVQAVSRIRKKLRRAGSAVTVQAVYGRGYRLTAVDHSTVTSSEKPVV